jgi:hypothetical protein
MLRGYAPVKGNVRRPRKGATIYRRPEIAVVFGAMEANPGSALFEGAVSDIPSPPTWQGGLLIKGTFKVDAGQPTAVPAMNDTQRLGTALLCYLQILPPSADEPPTVQRWRQWAEAWLDRRGPEVAGVLPELIELDWPSPGFRYLVHAGYQIATGTVLRDITPTVITQAMTDLLRIADQQGRQIEEEALAAIVQQGRTY